MNVMSNLSNIARSDGDPKVLETGPSSLTASDRVARALGWFSLGLGLTELMAPRYVTRALGMEGREGMVRAYGVREIGAGILSLSTEKQLGLWSRVAGDALDIATVMTMGGRGERRRGAVGMALIALTGVALVDLMAAKATTAQHSRSAAPPRFAGNRRYRDRSGFPQGLEAARGAAARDNEALAEFDLREVVEVREFGAAR